MPERVNESVFVKRLSLTDGSVCVCVLLFNKLREFSRMFPSNFNYGKQSQVTLHLMAVVENVER